jgi:hypothetical protein
MAMRQEKCCAAVAQHESRRMPRMAARRFSGLTRPRDKAT